MNEQINTQLPALKGTEKQIAWAERIRAEKLAALEAFIAEENDRSAKRIAKALARGGSAQDVHADIDGFTPDEILARARRRASAAWWIDHRSIDDGPLTLALDITDLMRKEQAAKAAQEAK